MVKAIKNSLKLFMQRNTNTNPALPDFEDLKELKDSIDKDSKKYFDKAKNLTTVAVVLFVIIYAAVNFWFVPQEEKQIVELAKANCSTTGIVTFHLVTRFLIGSFITAFFYMLIRLCFSGFDQAVRYRKRLHSAFFLQFLYKADVVRPIEIKEKMEFYKIWTEAIESAYSNVGFEKKNPITRTLEKLSSIKTIKGKDFEVELEK